MSFCICKNVSICICKNVSICICQNVYICICKNVSLLLVRMHLFVFVKFIYLESTNNRSKNILDDLVCLFVFVRMYLFIVQQWNLLYLFVFVRMHLFVFLRMYIFVFVRIMSICTFKNVFIYHLTISNVVSINFFIFI